MSSECDERPETTEEPFTPAWEKKAYCNMCSAEWPERYSRCPGCDAGKLNRRKVSGT